MTLAIFSQLGSGYATDKAFMAVAGDGAMPGDGDQLIVSSPIDGKDLTRGKIASEQQVNSVIGQAQHAFERLRTLPAPLRGEFVRRIGESAKWPANIKKLWQR